MVGPFDFFKGGAIFLNRSLPQVLREWCALYVLTSTCASRRSRMHFFNKWTAPNPSHTCFAPQRHAIFWFIIRPDGSAPAALASLLFDPPEPQNIGKTQWFATFLPFDALYSSFFWLILFSDLLSSPFLFSDSSHLCCFICPHMTSKLPLVTSYIHAGSWWHMSGSKPATSISHGGWLRTVFPVRGWLVTPINIG